MFTSKKAQYLNKDFDKISPITNIESLYYEQAKLIKNGDNPSKYIIKRKSVAKHMPIRMDICKQDISINKVDDLTNLGENYLNAYINTNFSKSFIENPSNPIDDKTIFDYPLYKIDASKYVNIQELLQYYTSIDSFSSSIGSINSSIDNINSSISNINSSIIDISIGIDNLLKTLSNHTEYYTWDELNTSTLENNGIYNLIYYPYESNNSSFIDSSFIIKIQCVYINGIKHLISLDSTLPLSIDTSYINQWDFHYDIDSSKITYLKDEYGNEGNFDFKNKKLANDETIGCQHSRDGVKNNYIYINPDNSNILFDKNSVAENCIINSTNILFLDNVYNNHIVNSSFNILQMQYAKNNKCSNIINSSLNITDGSNNILINCENCSIKIGGNNNTLINVKNLNVSLGNNNVIIGDEIGCQPNTSTLENTKLFFNYSTSTALATDHTSSCTFYGGNGNDVSVYVGSLRTT